VYNGYAQRSASGDLLATSGVERSAMASLKLYVLGPPRLEDHDQPITLNLRKALALIVYLVVSGQSQSRDALATLLWPDSDQREGRARLRRTLHRLQQDLGDSILDASPETIRLQPGAALWLDSAAFRQHVTAGLPAAPNAALAPDRLAHLEAAIDLYTDDFLAGFTLPDSPAFDEWQFFVRESLRQLYGQVLEQLIAAHRTAEAWDTAIPYARRWVALDALHEPAQRTLIQLYAQAGQPTAAARQYQECVRLLKAELGVAPEDETTALYEAIRTRQFAPPAPAEPPRVPPPAVIEPAPDERYVLEEVLATGGQGVEPLASIEAHEQQIRFCAAPDGVQIAYATVGAGPMLVKAANWLSHLEFDWDSPVWRHWLAGLSAHHTLVRYDERGCGLSDWDVDEFSLDAWVGDLETVVDRLGLERFPLLGISQGGAVAVAYAVRHPEKVSRLILYGSYARGWWKRNISPEEREETETLLTLTKLGWGRSNPMFRQVFTTSFIPEATIEQIHWFNDLQRKSTSPKNAVKFLHAFYEIDVSDLARQVTAPTLVLHAREDGRVPFAAGRELAGLIPGARFVPLESRNHILLESEPAWRRFLADVARFLGEPATAEWGRS
jgi:DNA-binding SARP family transcriptional activator/pimeloyl-ACP methyl ester carboxylesterase